MFFFSESFRMSWDALSDEISFESHVLNVISGCTVSLDEKTTFSFASPAPRVPADSYK